MVEALEYMPFLQALAGVLTKVWAWCRFPWWVEIHTTTPPCTYYFGPFDRFMEANSARWGYVEDLTHEGAQGITLTIKRCQPEVLTVYPSAEE